MSHRSDGMDQGAAPEIMRRYMAWSSMTGVLAAAWMAIVVNTDRLTIMLPEMVAWRIFFPSVHFLSRGFFPSVLDWTNWRSVWPVLAAGLIPAGLGLYTYTHLRRARSVGGDFAVWAPAMVAWHLLWIGYRLDAELWWREVRSATTISCPDGPVPFEILLMPTLSHFGGLAFLFGAAVMCRRSQSPMLRWIFVSITAFWLLSVAFPPD